MFMTKRVLTDESMAILTDNGLDHYFDAKGNAVGVDLDFLSDFADVISDMRREIDTASGEAEINYLKEENERLKSQNDEMKTALIEIDLITCDIEHRHHFNMSTIDEVVEVLDTVHDTARGMVREFDGEA